DGRIVGQITSGAYGHSLGGAIGLGYVPCRADESPAEMLASTYQIEVAGRLIGAEASIRPLYDPAAQRMAG
ncbi:MAG TPA: glycine cleavage T C-terminal barrel domain-containing protein, partial [Paracoccus sp. (in: a-proteobacteria)]|nr:glycine cleavage T C-terminal barrel domain-containing protein [Paracoccus sp. (in: a-proteobacteria)]